MPHALYEPACFLPTAYQPTTYVGIGTVADGLRFGRETSGLAQSCIFSKLLSYNDLDRCDLLGGLPCMPRLWSVLLGSVHEPARRTARPNGRTAAVHVRGEFFGRNPFSNYTKPGMKPGMWNTRSVQLNVRLPNDIATEAEEVQRSDPDFLSRVIQYGLTRRSIYRRLREGEARDRRVIDASGDSASGFA